MIFLWRFDILKEIYVSAKHFSGMGLVVLNKIITYSNVNVKENDLPGRLTSKKDCCRKGMIEQMGLIR